MRCKYCGKTYQSGEGKKKDWAIQKCPQCLKRNNKNEKNHEKTF